MIRELIARLVEGQSLSAGEAAAAMTEIIEGLATPAQIGAFLTALKMKGETAEELTGLAQVMRERAVRLEVSGNFIDTCGTGGDLKGTFNISTASAFVVAGSGLKVLKHGNRAFTSGSGSAEVLKLLGVNIEAGIDAALECLKRANIAFLFAPLFHRSMSSVAKPRQELGIRTAFNLLGPLTNPARPRAQVLGVYKESLTETIAQVLKNLGAESAMVVHGLDGMDEITTTDRTRVAQLKNGKIKGFYIKPEDYSIKRAQLKDLVIGGPEDSAGAIKEILDGVLGPKRDIVVLNAAAAIHVGGMAKDLKEAVDLAARSIASGSAKKCLERLAEYSWK